MVKNLKKIHLPNQATMYVVNVDKLIEIFIDCDDFCKVFIPILESKQLNNSPKSHNKASLSHSEMMTILIFYHLSGMKCFKYYYKRLILGHLKSYFPQAVSYTRFVGLIPRNMIYVWIYLNMVRKGQHTGHAYIDSKKLTVCHNKRIFQHKVFKHLAARGKSSVGWFYGFKLFLAINPVGEILECFITPGNVADNNQKAMRRLLGKLFGKAYGDKGFISSKISEEFVEKGLHIITKVRSNMKNKLMTLEDKLMLMKRGVIECVFHLLSFICDIDHSRHRSPANAFTHLFSGIIAYTYFDKRPSAFKPNLWI